MKLPDLPRPLPPAPTRYAFTVPGDPVPAQMGVRQLSGRVLTDKRAKSYREHVRVYCMLGIRQSGWTTRTHEESFAVTLRAFVGDARTIDCDNIAKNVLDAMKGYAFPDDRQVMRLVVEKSIDRERPRLEVEVERIA